MEPRRFQLEGPSLEALKQRVFDEHGPRARIIAAEKVSVGGIGGFLARHHYEVTVELPPRGRRAAAGPPDGPAAGRNSPAAGGISELLARAEAAEQAIPRREDPVSAGRPKRPEHTVSTDSDAFAELMDRITLGAGTPPAPPAPASPAPAAPAAPREGAQPAGRLSEGGHAASSRPPVPLTGAGDLVLVVGLGGDPLAVCESMAAAAGAGAAALRSAGTLEDPRIGRAGDRRAAATARAAGVLAEHPIYLAYGLGRGGELSRHATLIGALAPDQVWVAVDAGRKAEDSAAWVAAIRRSAQVDAVAVEGLDTTATPHTVNGLGLPIGWVDGGPSAAAVL